MASIQQILANRANAQFSTGPATQEGKQTVSANALTHGMTSKRVVLPWENEAEYNAFRESLIHDVAPEGDYERALAETVAATWWRLQRMRRVENAMWTARMQVAVEANPEFSDPEAAMAHILCDPAEKKAVSLALRYIGSAERAHRHAIAELNAAQKARRKRDVPETATAPAEEAQLATPAEQPQATAPQSLTRAERRRIELARRKAEKRARQTGFVSQQHAIAA